MKQSIINKLIEKYDKSNMYHYLKSFHEQIIASEDIFVNSNAYESMSSRLYPKSVGDNELLYIYNNIVLCGMGGSSIGGEFVKNIIDHSNLRIPFIINNNYGLPSFVNKKTLIIIVSYSGNTEEMISCYEHAKANKIKAYIITSGGYLLKEAKADNLNFIKIPENYPPRVAFGFMSTILLKLLIQEKLITNYNKEIKRAANIIHECSSSLENSEFDHWSSQYNCPSLMHPLELAEKLHQRKSEIFIYTTPLTKAIGYRFKCQLAENAKIISNLNSVPEMNHNEIEGYKNIKMTDRAILWLSDSFDSTKYINTSSVIDRAYNPCQYHLSMEKMQFISGQYLLLYYLDWVSYYLALLYKTDPTPVNLIQQLKKMS